MKHWEFRWQENRDMILYWFRRKCSNIKWHLPYMRHNLNKVHSFCYWWWTVINIGKVKNYEGSSPQTIMRQRSSIFWRFPNFSHWWEFVHTECWHDIILCATISTFNVATSNSYLSIKFTVSLIAYDEKDTECNQTIAVNVTFTGSITLHRVIYFCSLHVFLSLLLFHPFWN